jgi:hypothetical protein
MAGEVERLESSATSLTTEVASVEALLTTLSQMIRDAAQVPARVIAVADMLDSQKARLSAAVIANTPAAAA